MQLLVFISNSDHSVTPILAEFLTAGVKGATVVECEGMLHAIDDANIEPPPIFGSLRQFLNPASPVGKMIFVVLEDDMVSVAKEVIHRVSGTLKKPNTGILFTVPLSSVEGVS